MTEDFTLGGITILSGGEFVGAGDYSGTGVFSFLIENTSGAVDTGTVVGGKAHYAQVSSLGAEWSFGG